MDFSIEESKHNLEGLFEKHGEAGMLKASCFESINQVFRFSGLPQMFVAET